MKDKISKTELKRAARKAKKAHKKIKKFGYKKFFITLLVCFVIVAGSLFGYSYYKYQDPFYFFKDHSNEEINPDGNNPDSGNTPDSGDIPDGPGGDTNPDVTVKNTFYHEFKADELKDKTQLTVNGLSFTYPTKDFQDSVKGVRIGSSTKPQTEPWVLESILPKEATITDFAINIANNKNGKCTYLVEFGDYKYNGTSSSYEGEIIEQNNLNVSSSNFKLSLTNTKGSYLKSLKIKFNNPDFEVNEDVKKEINVVPGENGIVNTAYAVISIEEYYKDVDLLATGENLRNALREKLATNITSYTYDDARNMLPYTDERLDQKGVLYGVYDSTPLDAVWDNTWDREHIWPCSNMRIDSIINGGNYRPEPYTKDYRSDLHNLRAIAKAINSTRGDKFYGPDSKPNHFYPNKSNNPNDDFRGDCARIIFYMALRYKELRIVENPIQKSVEMGDLSLLKEWNEIDKPDAFEMQRNNRIYEYQGNRNPFIDYPELVNKLY